MRYAVGLPADQVGRELAEISDHFTPAQRPADDRIAVAVDVMHLENLLGQIKANECRLEQRCIPQRCRCNNLAYVALGTAGWVGAIHNIS